jgi:hypothetical protein
VLEQSFCQVCNLLDTYVYSLVPIIQNLVTTACLNDLLPLHVSALMRRHHEGES